MRIEIMLTLRGYPQFYGVLTWNLPVLPQKGDVVSSQLISRAFEPLKIYEKLNKKDKDSWDKKKVECENYGFYDDESEKECLKGFLSDRNALEVDYTAWGYFADWGEYPCIYIDEL